MNKPLRIIFAGTPEFAAIHLAKIIQQNLHKLVCVYTQPDRPAGRGKKLMASPVKELALQHNIPVFQPATLKTEEEQKQLASLQADLMVVVAYGLILPQAVLDIPTLGCINSHASLLPRWRGAAPIQRAIQAGDKETGITVMQMEAGLDTGPMLLKATIAITEQDNGGSLHDRLAELGATTVIKAIDGLANKKLTPEKQDDSVACYAHKLNKEEAEINWQLAATDLSNTVRAFNPWPICYSFIDGVQLKVLEAHVEDRSGKAGEIINISKEGLIVTCGKQALCITKLQLPNSKPLPFWDVYNGHKELFTPHRILGK
ncbi:methionyl-tRNA formyltransferase [Entomomonas moraniae]|uniref:Methionyl-tRNA formyltransferase n=1 Tax=Entomomonas moraniae TaxID=2213226 RepID=A0A451EQA4_9GAMM|nr:methionyl-tRNA formyltransferase [Entomomonas moraniae]AZS52014.1 methionyl-tRNA formyltransferase [Entomomonas moraniae]